VEQEMEFDNPLPSPYTYGLTNQEKRTHARENLNPPSIGPLAADEGAGFGPVF
jgi:hypothetical protein